MTGLGNAESQARWRALLAADYFTIPPKCPTCRSGRACGNFFCVQCMVGGVCRTTFEAGGDHAHHPRIQVWKVTRMYAVRVDDLRNFIMSQQLDQIQKYWENQGLHCKFVGSGTRNTPTLRQCHGCRESISHSTIPNLSASPVCSIMCLLDYAAVQQRPVAGERWASPGFHIMEDCSVWTLGANHYAMNLIVAGIDAIEDDNCG